MQENKLKILEINNRITDIKQMYSTGSPDGDT